MAKTNTSTRTSADRSMLGKPLGEGPVTVNPPPKPTRPANLSRELVGHHDDLNKEQKEATMGSFGSQDIDGKAELKKKADEKTFKEHRISESKAAEPAEPTKWQARLNTEQEKAVKDKEKDDKRVEATHKKSSSRTSKEDTVAKPAEDKKDD